MVRRTSILVFIAVALACAASLSAFDAASGRAELPSNAFGGLEAAGGTETAAEAAEKEANRNAHATSASGPSALVIVAIVGGVVLLGSAFLIVRDARKVAPVPDGPGAGAVSAESRAATIRRRRSKAKAAKRQRKRNR
jgi:hypothetical protein